MFLLLFIIIEIEVYSNNNRNVNLSPNHQALHTLFLLIFIKIVSILFYFLTLLHLQSEQDGQNVTNRIFPIFLY